MKRILGHVVSLLVCALAVSAAAPACTDNDQSLFIRGALLPSANRQNGACIYTDDPQQPIIFAGAVDLGLRNQYEGTFIVGNQLIPRGDPLAVRAESSRAHINGGIVRITRPDGTLIREFTAAATGFADPQNNNAPDFGVMSMVVLDAPTAVLIRQSLAEERDRQNPRPRLRDLSVQVIANIKVIGKTLGGTDLESAEFSYPINVCVGCFVAGFTADVNDTTNPRQPNCLKAPTSVTPAGTVQPCKAGQDYEGSKCSDCLNLEVCRFAD